MPRGRKPKTPEQELMEVVKKINDRQAEAAAEWKRANKTEPKVSKKKIKST